MSLYHDLYAAGATMDSHESDLYVKATPVAVRTVKASGLTFSYFVHQITHERWIEVPFAYVPWWERRAAR